MESASVQATPESARARIFREAARIYAFKGYAGTSIREIAEAAGVTKPLVYYHFESKERLYLALLLEAMDRWQAEVVAIVVRPDSAKARLRDLLGLMVREAREVPEILCFVTDALTLARRLPLDFDYMARGRELFQKYVDLIDDGQGNGEFRAADSTVVAATIVATVRLYVGAVMAGELDEVPENLDETLYGILVNGLEASNP
jgi:AcrR family transcriptional regulator